MEKKLLSVALATYNEEANLASCLASVKNWVDEIVIVDGGSTDKTLAIASQFEAKIIETDNPLIFHINKQKALDACRNEWILQLDADEEVSDELAKEIQSVIGMTRDELQARNIPKGKLRLFERHHRILKSQNTFPCEKARGIVAFFVPRRNYFLGHPMTYAGTYPDGVIRLVKKSRVRFPSKSVHEQIIVDGEVAWLMNDLLHYSNPTMQKYLSGANKYTRLLALQISKKSHQAWFLFFLYCFIKPLSTFFNLFIRHKGFLDGIYGFLFSFFSSLHYPVAYIKYVDYISEKKEI